MSERVWMGPDGPEVLECAGLMGSALEDNVELKCRHPIGRADWSLVGDSTKGSEQRLCCSPHPELECNPLQLNGSLIFGWSCPGVVSP